MTPNLPLPLYDFDALRAMARATAYPPLPIEPHEERAPASSLVADDKPAAPKPAPAPAPEAPKPAYEPLPTEIDTREIKPRTTR
jgi:hypothetical protein